MKKSEKILLLANIVLVGFVIGVVFHYILGAYLHLPFPYNTFLFRPEAKFTDFTLLSSATKNLTPFSEPNWLMIYFPFAYIFLVPFAFLKNQIFAYCLFMFLFLSLFIYLNIKIFKCKNLTKLQNFQNIFILTLLSFPILIILDRGNIDMLLFIFFAGFIYFFKSKRYLFSSIVLAVINAVKPFTIVFLLLFLFKKKYKEFFLSLTISGFLIIGGFLLLKEPFFHQISVFLINLKLYKQIVLYSNNSELFLGGSSLFMMIRILLSNLAIPPLLSTTILTKGYNIISLIIMTTTIFFAYREKIFWKQITLLTLTMLLLPYIMCDYKLIFLFVPVWLFVNFKEKSHFDSIYTILFGLLLIPKKFIFVSFTKLFFFAAIANPIIIILFMSLIIFEQFQSKQL